MSKSTRRKINVNGSKRSSLDEDSHSDSDYESDTPVRKSHLRNGSTVPGSARAEVYDGNTSTMSESAGSAFELPPPPEYIAEPAITDPVLLGGIVDECTGLFQSHKITPQNAFSLKLIECFDEVLKLDSFDKRDMQKIGKTLEVGTKIFSCRVEYTHDTVLNLAENVAEKKKKKQGRGNEEEQNGDNEQGSDGELNESRYELDEDKMEFETLDGGVMIPKDLGNDKMRNKNIGEERQFDMEDIAEESGELRRIKLKEAFDGYALHGKKFDYASVIFGEEGMGEKRRRCAPTKVNELRVNASIINTSAMGHMGKFDFFRLDEGSFDSDKFDIWGIPTTAEGLNANEDAKKRVIEKRKELKKRLSSRMDDLLSQSQQYRNSQSQQFENGGHDDHAMDMDLPADEPEPFYGPDNCHLNISQDARPEEDSALLPDQNFNPIGEDGQLKPLDIDDITTLDDLDTYFDALKNFKMIQPNLYGWTGLNFIRNRRPKPSKSAGPRRKKPQTGPLNLLEVDWDLPANRYCPAPSSQTTLSNETLVQWGGFKPYIPFMGECDDDPDDEDDVESVYFTGHTAAERLMKFFVDNQRDIFDRGLNGRSKPASQGCEGDGSDDHFEDHVYGNPEFAAGLQDILDAAGDEDAEGIRQLAAEFIALGTNDDFIGEGEMEILKRHKMLGTDDQIGSEAQEYALSRFSTESDTLKYSRRPKPINISRVKECIKQILKEYLELDGRGAPLKDEATETDMLSLLTEMVRRLDAHIIQHLTLPITLVATLHVVVETNLFMDSGELGSMENPKIICRGKNFNHGVTYASFRSGREK